LFSDPKYCTGGKLEKKDEVSDESPAATLLMALLFPVPINTGIYGSVVEIGRKYDLEDTEIITFRSGF
jgi:hypothetical protein